MPKNTKKTILVTGATGHQGGSVFRALREKGFSLRVLTRDPGSEKARSMVGPGVEVLRGDLNEPGTLGMALDELFGVYSVQNPMQSGDAEQEINQANTLADAANRADVSHFVYSSAAGIDQGGPSFFENKRKTEEHLRGTGLKYTILRPVSFMENWLGMREQIEQQGKIALPMSPETRMQLIAVDDIGVFAAMAFEKPGAWQGRTVTLAGDQLSMTGIAEAFSRATGREVKYEQMSWEECERNMGRDFALMYRVFEREQNLADIPALRQENPNLTNFERWLNTKWAASTTAAAS